MTGGALVPVHGLEGLLAVVAGPAGLALCHGNHGERDASPLHLEQAGMAVAALGPAGEMGCVRERDGTRRPCGREGHRRRAGCGSLGAEAVALGAGLVGFVLGFVCMARETGLSRRRQLLVFLVPLVARHARHGCSRRSDLMTAAAGGRLRGAARVARVALDPRVLATELPWMGERSEEH